LPPELVRLNEKLKRTVDTVYYTVDRTARMSAGGVFSLDGVHPAAVGHGLIAQEFLQVMEREGVKPVRALYWNAIAASDSLYANPIALGSGLD
jgi:hypothetical protein